MVEVARVMTLGIADRKELIQRLIDCSDFFKNLSFWDAAEQYRYAERNGLVRVCNGYLVVYHDCEN